MINELKAIAIFVEVVRAGSFRGGARQLGLSPSAVSYHVAQLEKRVGNALIYRSTRKLSLTQEGEQLFHDASELLSGIAGSLENIAGQGSELHGRLTISATTALLHSPLSEKIARFCKTHPRVGFEIRYTDERQDPVAGGIDLVLRAGDMPDSSLKSRLVFQIKRKLVCSRAYYKTHAVPKSPRDLNDWKWIKLTMMSSRRVFGKANRTMEAGADVSQVSVNSVDAMVELCTHDLGLATPPDYLVEKLLKKGSLVEVLPDWQVQPIPVHAVWPGNPVKSRNAHNFIKLISDMS